MFNTPEVNTERLILRKFNENDVEALYNIMIDEEVNRYLPLFPFKSVKEAEKFLHDTYLNSYKRPLGFRYAICLQSDNIPIGYVNMASGESHDFGYGLARAYWQQGIATEASTAVLEQIKKTDIPFITATHDINNYRSGNVLKKLGMKYCYSYEELWQPKNIPVTFRMYQLNLDGQDERVYMEYWDKYSTHFLEENV